MYKRRAQVLFLDYSGHSHAAMAAALAGELGGDWLTGRGAAIAPEGLAPGVDEVMADAVMPVPGVDEQALEWADLVVMLDPETREACPPVPPGTRAKPWSLPAPGEIGLAELRDDLRERITCMIGGMRMLARVDAGDEEE
jgi:hypothetical protein